MAQKRDTTDLKSISSIIETVSGDLNIEKGLRSTYLAEIWPEIVGPRFEKKSTVSSIQERNGFDIIMVAVSSSSVAQELIIYKNDIIKKIYKTAKEHKFKIKDIQFQTKIWR